MISGSECRDIAAQLRKSRDFVSSLPKASLEQMAFDTFERVLECVHYEGGNLFDYLADLIDRPTCRNVYDKTEECACKNGFKCSECGELVEDYEGYRITGTFNCCPMCEREVVGE